MITAETKPLTDAIAAGDWAAAMALHDLLAEQGDARALSVMAVIEVLGRLKPSNLACYNCGCLPCQDKVARECERPVGLFPKTLCPFCDRNSISAPDIFHRQRLLTFLGAKFEPPAPRLPARVAADILHFAEEKHGTTPAMQYVVEKFALSPDPTIICNCSAQRQFDQAESRLPSVEQIKFLVDSLRNNYVRLRRSARYGLGEQRLASWYWGQCLECLKVYWTRVLPDREAADGILR